MQRAERRGAGAGRPLAIVLIGFAVAVIGVVTTYVFPETRKPGLSAAVVLQCVAIFGGMAAMLVGAALASTDAEAGDERAPTLREVTRGGLAFLLALGALYPFCGPLSFLFAAAATPAVAARLRRIFAWLGAP